MGTLVNASAEAKAGRAARDAPKTEARGHPRANYGGQIRRPGRVGGGGPELLGLGRAGIASSNRRVHDGGRRAAAGWDRDF